MMAKKVIVFGWETTCKPNITLSSKLSSTIRVSENETIFEYFLPSHTTAVHWSEIVSRAHNFFSVIDP